MCPICHCTPQSRSAKQPEILRARGLEPGRSVVMRPDPYILMPPTTKHRLGIVQDHVTHAFWDTQPVPAMSESTEDLDDSDGPRRLVNRRPQRSAPQRTAHGSLHTHRLRGEHRTHARCASSTRRLHAQARLQRRTFARIRTAYPPASSGRTSTSTTTRRARSCTRCCMRTTSRTATPHAHTPTLSSTSVAPGRGCCASARHARRLWAARRAPGQRPGRWVPCHCIGCSSAPTANAAECTLPLATTPCDNMFHFDYSPAFPRPLSPPGFKPEWHVGVRVTQVRRRAR